MDMLPTGCAPHTPHPRPLAPRRALRVGASLAGLALALATTLAAPRPSLAWNADDGPDAIRVRRSVLVKASGAGRTPLEAETKALAAARGVAIASLKPLGGAAALAEGPDARRVLGLRRGKAPGPGPERAVVLLELRLRRQQEPLPEDLGLPVLRAAVDAGVLHLWASRPCEAAAVLSRQRGGPAELQPGLLRPAPGRPARTALRSPEGGLLGVLACTDGLGPAAAAGTEAEIFAALMAAGLEAQPEGAASHCVELWAGRVHEGGRALRQQSPEAPVNMSGAAGRDAALPKPERP